jgi:hypothetical protein
MKKGQTSPPLSGEELRFLRDNYTEHTAAWIGSRLGRSQGAIIKQARRLGLSKKRGRPIKGSVYVKFNRNRKKKGGNQ